MNVNRNSNQRKQHKPGTVGTRFRKLKAFQTEGQAVLSQAAGLGACAVWMALWAAEDAATMTASVGRRKLAKRLGVDERTVRRHLSAIIAAGYAQRLTLGTKGKSASTYRVHAVPISKRNEGTKSSPNPSRKLGDKSVPQSAKWGDRLVQKEGANLSPTQSPTETVSGGADAHSVRYAAGAAPLPSCGPTAGESSATGTIRDPAALRWLFGKLTKSRTETISTDGLPADVLALFGHEDEINGPAPGIGARIDRDKREIELMAY